MSLKTSRIPQKSIRILGTGYHVPEKVLTNQDLENMGLDTSNEWIVQRTGIRERRVADKNEATSQLAHKASLMALGQAGIGAKDLDLIVVATVTPDTCCPSAGNWLEAALGADNAVSFDVTAACSGFIYALNVASQYLLAGTAKFVLVAAAEVMTRTVNWKDRSTCILWGDGAGAVVLALGESGPEILSSALHSDGKNGSDLLLPGGGSRTTPISHESVDKGLHYLDLINADQSFRVAVRCFMQVISDAAAGQGLTSQALDWIIPHQANLRMFQYISKALNIPMERFYITIDRFGNISSASCAVALAEAAQRGCLKAGQLVCLPVFGGGLTWGSALIRW